MIVFPNHRLSYFSLKAYIHLQSGFIKQKNAQRESLVDFLIKSLLAANTKKEVH